MLVEICEPQWMRHCKYCSWNAYCAGFFVRSIDWNQFSLWPSFGMVLFTVFNGLALTRLYSIFSFFISIVRYWCCCYKHAYKLNLRGSLLYWYNYLHKLMFIYALVIKLSGAPFSCKSNDEYRSHIDLYSHTQIELHFGNILRKSIRLLFLLTLSRITLFLKCEFNDG